MLLYEIHRQNSWGKTLVYITYGSMCVIVVLTQKASEKSISQMSNICSLYYFYNSLFKQLYLCTIT